MVQTKRKTNVVALAIVLSLVLVFAMAVALFAMPATDTAHALDNVAEFHFYNVYRESDTAGKGSRTNGGITFNYSGSYYNPSNTSCIVLEAGGSFTVTVSNSALNNKNITKVKYALTTDYASGAGTGTISAKLMRGSTTKATGTSKSSGVDISGSGDLKFTITNNNKSDRSQAYRFTTNFTLMAPSQVAVTVSAGTGVKEVFLSSAQSGSPVAASGSKFAENTTVYAFAQLAKGYQAQSGWGLVSGNANSEDAVYRTGSKKITTSSKDFGTINASLKTKALVLNGNGGENGADVTLTYGQATTVNAISREGYNFLGWNTNADGTGETYGNSDGASLTVEQVNAILDDGTLTALYAMWKAETNTVIAYINAIGEVEYTQACKDKIDAARTLYDSLDTADQALVTNYETLTDAEAIYAALKADNEAADAVDALIDAIGNPVTLADKDAINAAREAYDVLTPAQKALVDDLAALEDAEATYSELEAAYHAARALVGDGSLENPYLIERVEQLEHFRDIVLGVNGETQNSEACVVLTADIDLGGSVDNVWTPIGGQNSLAYLGTFDGQGHKITGLYVSGENTIGLFGRVNSGAVIKNLTVYGTAIATDAGSYQGGVAGIVGYLRGSVINCHNYVSVSSTSTERWKGYAGGIAGQMYSSSVISNCSNYGEISSTSATVGGIVGQVYGGTVTNSYNYAPVTGTEYVGGIAGSVASDGTVSYCFNYGYVVATSCAPAGGVAGYSVPGGSGAATFDANYYLTGRLTVNSVAQNGGICAYNETTEDWDYKDIEGQLEPLTENQMRDQASFVGWDFDDVWTMGNDHPVFYDSGIRICGSIVDNFVTSGEGWSFDKATKTLTLNNFQYKGEGTTFDEDQEAKNAVIFYQGTEELYIVSLGENIIENTFDDEQKNIYGIYSNGSLTIKGEGSLDVSVTGKGGHTFAIGSMSTLTLDAAAITATGGPARYNSIGFYANYDGILINSGAVTATGGTSDNNYSYGIWSYGADASSGTAGTVIAKKVKSVTAKGDTLAIRWGLLTYIDGIGWEYDGLTETEKEIPAGNYVYPSADVFTLHKIELVGVTVDDVIALINAIPDPVVYTQDCKDAIDEARKAYETLETDEKILVTNYDDLTDAESIYNGMQSDKESLDLYKNTQKGEADDLALEGDSAACADLISDAKDAIDALSYDCTKTLDENKAAVDKIIDDLANALALQRDKDAFEAYKAPSKEAADELALESDSAACDDLIANAKNDIDALNYDEEKTLDENKAMIDGIVDALEDALALQRDKDAFEAYKAPSKEAADELAIEGDSAACEELITGAKEAIDALAYDEDKDLDGNKATVDAIMSALADALALQRDKDAFEAYKAPSKENADDLALEGDSAACEELIAGAKEAIDALAYDEDKDLDGNKAAVDAIVADLADALALQRDKDALDAYKAEQKDNADELAIDGDSAACEELIAGAKEAIDALAYDEDKDLDGNKAAVDAILAELADALALQRDKDDFEAYKVPSKEAADDLALEGDSAACGTLIANAKDAIDALNYDEEKTLIENEAIINGMVNDLANALALQRDKDAFEAYKVPSKEDADDLALEGDSTACETLIANAKDAIDALAYDEDKTLAENKAIIDGIVDALEDALALQRDNEAAAADVDALIDAIPDPVTYPDSKGAIEAARNAYDDLKEDQKALVKDLNDLTAAEADYKELEDAAKANAVKDLIDSIGNVEYTEDCKEKIDAAIEAFNELTDDQKALIEEDVPTMVNADDTYQVLRANNVAAAEVIALIEAIGEVEYTEESKAKIDAAKAAYEALTAEQKALVNNVNTQTTAETTYATLKADNEAAEAVIEKINEIGKVEYKAESKAKISAARQAYDNLTDAQKALLDATEVETLTTAETVYKQKEIGTIVGSVVGSVAFVGGLIILILFLLKKKKNNDKNGTEQNDEPKQAESNNDEAAK